MSQSPINRVQPMSQSRSRSPVLSLKQQQQEKEQQISSHKSTPSPAASFRRHYSERRSLAFSPRSDASTSFKEREELQNLNDRLALIIQRVRKLES